MLALKIYSFLDHHCHAVVFGSGSYANSVLLITIITITITISVISSLWIVILRQFSFVHKKNVHRVYILIFHILEFVNSLFF